MYVHVWIEANSPNEHSSCVISVETKNILTVLLQAYWFLDSGGNRINGI